MPQPGPRVWQRATPGGRGLCLAKPGRHHRPGRASTSTGGPTARPALSQPRQRAERRRGLAVTRSPGQALLCPLRPIPERPRSGQGNPGLWTSLVCLDRKPASLLQVPKVRARRMSPGGLTQFSPSDVYSSAFCKKRMEGKTKPPGSQQRTRRPAETQLRPSAPPSPPAGPGAPGPACPRPGRSPRACRPRGPSGGGEGASCPGRPCRSGCTRRAARACASCSAR